VALRPRLTTGLLLTQSTEGGAPAHVHADMNTSARQDLLEGGSCVKYSPKCFHGPCRATPKP
jgi:hypothetical protein